MSHTYPSVISAVFTTKDANNARNALISDDAFTVQDKFSLLADVLKLKYELDKKECFKLADSGNYIMLEWHDSENNTFGTICYDIPKKVKDWLNPKTELKALQFEGWFVASSWVSTQQAA